MGSVSGGGADPGCVTQPGHPPPGLRGCSSPRWPWGPGLGAALQTRVRGSVLQTPGPPTAPAASRGSVLAPPSPCGAGPGHAAAPCGQDHMSLRCRCDAAAKAEHHFPPLLLLQTGGGGGRGDPVCTSLGCSRVGGTGFSPPHGQSCASKLPQDPLQQGWRSPLLPHGRVFRGPSSPTQPPNPCSAAPSPRCPPRGAGRAFAFRWRGSTRSPAARRGGEARPSQEPRSKACDAQGMAVLAPVLLPPPAPQGTVPFPYAGRARLAGSRARAEQCMHPAAAASGLGGRSEAPLLRGERGGQLGAPGGFPKPGAR